MNKPNITNITNQKIQEYHLMHLDKIYEEGLRKNSSTYLPPILQHIKSMKPCGALPIYFYDFWFNKLLTTPSNIFINCIKPEFDEIFEFSPRQKAEHIERYLAILSDSEEFQLFSFILENSIKFKVLIEPSFIEKIQENPNFSTKDKKIAITLSSKIQKDFFDNVSKIKY